MSDKTNALGAFILDEAKKWAARTAIMATVAILVLIFAPFRDRIIAIWTSPTQLQEISAKLDQLSAELARATGEDRVIHEPQGLSYVREPVYVGQAITLNLVVRRTRLGETCTLLNRTAIFTDETSIAAAGATVRPARQISGSDTAVRIALEVPSQVQPGRVTVYLSLEFDCGGKKVFDATRPVAFALVPAHRGAP
ncbi:hypothetical protein [Paracoccus sp. ME4]|uniref:hypothetical protein n=1 Tax=Paracoccus sp. ME4 TaxID=3138066 RepID=UPI00398B1C69